MFVSALVLSASIVAQLGQEPNRPTLRPQDHFPTGSTQPGGDDVRQTAHEEVVPAADARKGMRISPRTRPPRNGADQSNQDAEGGAAAPRTAAGRTAWWISTAGGLLVVLGAALLAARLLKAMTPGGGLGESGPLHVLYRAPLGHKQAALLVKCGRRLLLIGSSGERLCTLAEIVDPEEVDLLRGLCMQVRPRSTTRAFQEALRSKADELESADLSAPAPAGTSAQDFASFLGSVKSRLAGGKGGRA